MVAFQWLALVLVVGVFLKTIKKYKKGELAFREFLFWLILWGASFFVILLPETSSFLAVKLGIGRGVDLILYAGIGLIFYILFKIIVKIEKIEGNITVLVRELALRSKDVDKK